MLIIAERINSSRKRISEAIILRNEEVIKTEVEAQVKVGADYIEVNAGTLVGEEISCLKWLIETVREVTDCPLCVDSSDTTVLKSVLPWLKGEAMINSISLEASILDDILPLVNEYGYKVIGLCKSGTKLAETAEEKVRMAGELVEKATNKGVLLDNLYIDPLVSPIGTNLHSAVATLEAIERIMREFVGVHTTCGLSNVSYGLPNRSLINRVFLTVAISRGLDCAIIDPTDKKLQGVLKAANVIMGKDDFCREYVIAFREGKLD